MTPTWTADEFEHEVAASELAPALGIDRMQVRRFDVALAGWLRAYGDALTSQPPDPATVPGLHDTPADRSLAASIEDLGTGGPGLYAWSRLLKAEDALWGGRFGWRLTGPLLGRYLEQTEPPTVDPDAALGVIRYFAAGSADSPNSGAFGAIWELAARSGLFEHHERRQAALVAFLDLIERRSFHHTLGDLEGILEAVQDGDGTAHARLRDFHPDNDQGAAIIAGAVMRLVNVRSAASARAAARVLEWLVDAKGREPTERWHRRLEQLGKTVDHATLDAVCSQIADCAHYARHAATGWRDELFWFMWKTGAWYDGRTPRPILEPVS